MSANDSEHFARESRSPPGTHSKKPIPPKEGWVFYLDLIQALLSLIVALIYRDLLAVLHAEAGRILCGGSPRIVRS